MFLFKIGKDKIRYKLTMSMHRLKCQEGRPLTAGHYFKVQVIRGSHSALFTTQPIRRAQIKCNKDEHTIPLTLFYNSDDKTFLQKEMEINGFLMNGLDEVEAELGRAIVNVSEYVTLGDKSNEKFLLQVQLSDQKDRQTTIKFHMNIQKQDDDSKSIQSSQTNQNTKRGSDSAQKQPMKNNIKAHKIDQSECSSKFDSYSKQTSPDKQERKINSSKEKKKAQSFKDYGQTQKQPKKKDTVYQEQQENFFKLTTPDVSRKLLTHDDDQTKTVDMNFKKNTTAPRPPLPKDRDRTQDNQSGELKNYLNERSLREKEKELQAVKRQVLSQKKVIQQLMQEQHNKMQSVQTNKYLREIQSLKNQLLQANIKVSELQTATRHYKQQEEESSELIEKQAKKIAYYKDLLEKEKLKIARIMQRGLESGDNDLISFIEQALTGENNND